MKDKIISFLLTTIILSLLGAIALLGYIVYKEMSEEGIIKIQFEEYTGFPQIEFVSSNEDAIKIEEELFQGVAEYENSIKGNPKYQSRFLYEQLDETAKAIYVKLYENKENLKTGTYTIEFGSAFRTLLLQPEGTEILKKQYQSAIEALIYENPDIFYLNVEKMYIRIETITKITGTKYKVFIEPGDEISYLADGFYSKEDVEEYENKIEAIKNQIVAQVEGKSDYEKIKLIHDYLIDSIEYKTELEEDNVYNIYGALVKKKCVCEGYAKAFQYLMNEVGIENTIVIGEGTNSKGKKESHAWNYVRLNEKWYTVDVTWDDPIITGPGKLTKQSKYKYFLKGSKTMNENHFPSGKFTTAGQTFVYPELSIEDYQE